MKHIVIAGPTASGKTELALALAQHINSDIISADSRQIYTDLTVGTAKPQGAWQNGQYLVANIPYHLVDFLPPDRTFDVFSFCEKSRALVAAQPDKPFIFAGGTGMYLHAFFIGIDALPPADENLRKELAHFADQNGREALHARLARTDPFSAAQIPPQNIHRLIRALEICHLTGRPASEVKTGAFFQKEFPTEKALFVYLNWDKELLQARIVKRTQGMLEPMAAETCSLLGKGFAPTCAGLKSLGYPEILQWIDGKITREETLEKIVIRTRQYAKRQRTWFNRYGNVLRVDITRPQDFDPEKISRQISEKYNSL